MHAKIFGISVLTLVIIAVSLAVGAHFGKQIPILNKIAA